MVIFPAHVLKWKLHSSKRWCAAMQMDVSLPCWKEGKEETLPPFSPGSLLSRQPKVKTHDHHSFSLYHHNVPRPHRLTISYTLKFMTSSQSRNWFSMLRFPPPRFWSLFWFSFSMAVRLDVLNFCSVQLHLMLWSQIWWCSKKNKLQVQCMTINNAIQWLQISIPTLKTSQ